MGACCCASIKKRFITIGGQARNWDYLQRMTAELYSVNWHISIGSSAPDKGNMASYFKAMNVITEMFQNNYLTHLSVKGCGGNNFSVQTFAVKFAPLIKKALDSL